MKFLKKKTSIIVAIAITLIILAASLPYSKHYRTLAVSVSPGCDLYIADRIYGELSLPESDVIRLTPVYEWNNDRIHDDANLIMIVKVDGKFVGFSFKGPKDDIQDTANNHWACRQQAR